MKKRGFMKTCVHCGMELEPDWTTCPKCGVRLVSVKEDSALASRQSPREKSSVEQGFGMAAGCLLFVVVLLIGIMLLNLVCAGALLS